MLLIFKSGLSSLYIVLLELLVIKVVLLLSDIPMLW